METTNYVTYYTTNDKKSLSQTVFSGTTEGNSTEVTTNNDLISGAQKRAVQEFLGSYNQPYEVVGSFSDTLGKEHRRSAKWPSLDNAIKACQQHNATLIIAELGALTNNETFTQTLLNSETNFYCCDQPFVNQTILEALCKHAQVQKKLHGKLIREGLKMTSAKSGNPNAAEVISKVNKPKIDAAIVFALLLQPIVNDYRRKGFSQRQMVKALNEEGFTAPEGGKWVLSQLQKVLDRIRLNEIVNNAKATFEELIDKNLSLAQIADEFNQRSISSIKREPWDEEQVKKLQDRLTQIKEISLTNKFVLNLLPVIHELRRKQFSAVEMIKTFEKNGVPIQQKSEVAA